MGFDPVKEAHQFIAQLDDETAYAFVDVGAEVLRMLKTGDTETNDSRARDLYRQLFDPTADTA